MSCTPIAGRPSWPNEAVNPPSGERTSTRRVPRRENPDGKPRHKRSFGAEQFGGFPRADSDLIERDLALTLLVFVSAFSANLYSLGGRMLQGENEEDLSFPSLLGLLVRPSQQTGQPARPVMLIAECQHRDGDRDTDKGTEYPPQIGPEENGKQDHER